MEEKPPIFIGGAARSGTTLLRVILDTHPDIACGPELKITPVLAQLWYDFRTKYFNILKELLITQNDINRLFADMTKGLIDKYKIASGKKRIAEKTPNNVNIFPHLHEIFPKSPLIHVIRDGRDVVASLLTMKWQTPDGKPIDYTQDIKKAAQYWVNTVSRGRRFAAENQSGSPVYFEIQYEDIVKNPEVILPKLFEFIDEKWTSEVLQYYRKQHDLGEESSALQVRKKIYTGSVGRWRNDLSIKQKNIFKSIAGELLIELGYSEGLDW